MDKAATDELRTILRDADSGITAEIQKDKEEQDRIDKKRSAYLDKITPILKKQSIDIESLLVPSNEDEKLVRSEIKQEPDQLISKSSSSQNNFTSEIISLPVIPAWILLPDYYTKVYKLGQVIQEGQNLGDIKIWDYVSGTGCGWGASGEITLRFRIFRVYWFQPTSTRIHHFSVFIPYRGFYKVVSNDGFWDFKEAWARIDGRILAEQDGHNTVNHNYSHLSIVGENINTSGTIDVPRDESVTALLGAGKPAWIKLYQDFSLKAVGGGSVAQLDFFAETWNYHIPPPRVYVQ
jgi:hypothetical protein